MTHHPELSEFTDWLVEGPDGKWPSLITGDQLNKDQQAIVERNANLLLNRGAWHSKIHTFENKLKSLFHGEDAYKRNREKYLIRFDGFRFEPINGKYDFGKFHFPCGVSFAGTTFGDGHVSFDRAMFGDGGVSFHGTKFGNGRVSFDRATFGEGSVLFMGATFGKGIVSFSWTKFGDGSVLFIATTFGKGNVSFEGATFGDGDVWFTFNHLDSTSVDFKGTEVGGNLFVETRFPEKADFQRLEVGGTAQFSDCAFAETPDFRDAKFDRPLEVARMEVPAPDLGGRRFLFRICEDEDAVAKYRKLKAMALASSDHEMDGKFFAYEMMAKRGMETNGFFPLLFNSLYGILGGYGQSFTKPMKGLLASWLLFGIVYFGLASSVLSLSDRILFAAEYSVRSAIPLLNSLFRFSISPSDSYRSGFEKRFSSVEGALGNIDWFTYLAVTQQFIGLVLLFLLLLALRNTFRLK